MASFLENLRLNLRIADVIDVAVISVFLYFCLGWLRRRASPAVGLGLLVVAGLYICAHVLDMYLTQMMFQVGLAVILLCLVIVFQQDVRRGFEQLSTLTIGPQSTGTTQSFDELVDTVTVLAEQRIGALIVFAGRESLAPHVHGGTNVDGLVSQALLHSIFYPKSRGHDGAVLIVKDRVESLGVHLPLSNSVEKLGPTGTRHAAALGLAECCDALIVVVSEERGTISVAEQGELTRIESPTALKKRVDEFYVSKFPQRDQQSWYQPLFKDSGTKVMAVLLACLMWLVFAYRVEIVQRTFEDVPIEYRNLPDGWSTENQTPTKLRVTLRGSERAHDGFNAKSLRASIDLSQIVEGEQTITLSDENFNLPPELSVSDLDYDEVQFTASRMMTVVLPVQIQTSGKVGGGLRVVEMISDPARVPVTIRQSDQTSFLVVHTKEIDLTQIKGTTTIPAELIAPSLGRFAGNRRPIVMVTIKVAQ